MKPSDEESRGGELRAKLTLHKSNFFFFLLLLSFV
jgi:hypothetical protein